jgi:hypothetical protein
MPKRRALGTYTVTVRAGLAFGEARELHADFYIRRYQRTGQGVVFSPPMRCAIRRAVGCCAFG